MEKILDTRYKIQDTGYRIQDKKIKVTIQCFMFEIAPLRAGRLVLY